MNRAPTVFIVDDEEGMCRSLMGVIQNAGYKVAYATSGQSALQSIGYKNIDLFLLDIHMPGLSGFKLLERLLLLRPNTPVIMVTGDTTVNSAVQALRLGAYDYLRKPIEPEELLKTIENALQQKMLLERAHVLDNRLKLSQRRFRFLLQNSADVFYTLDTTGRFRFVKESVTKNFGYRTTDLVGKHYESVLWEEDIPRARWRFNERRTGTRATSGLTLRLKPGPFQTAKFSNGNFAVVELYATGIYSRVKTRGKPLQIGTYGLLRDRSRRETLQKDRADVKNLERAVGKVLNGLGQDLNDLLDSARKMVTSVKQNMASDHPYLKQIEVIDNYLKNSQNHSIQLSWLANGGYLDDRNLKVKTIGRKVSFRLIAPDASEVHVGGDFNGWDPEANPLKKDADGRWRTTLLLPSGRYEFKFIVDGKWREDLINECTVFNSYGTRNNVVVVDELGSNLD